MNSIEPANSKEQVYRVWEGNEGQTRSKEMRYFKADLVLETNDWKLAKEA
jgi:hypothetical protein